MQWRDFWWKEARCFETESARDCVTQSLLVKKKFRVTDVMMVNMYSRYSRWKLQLLRCAYCNIRFREFTKENNKLALSLYQPTANHKCAIMIFVNLTFKLEITMEFVHYIVNVLIHLLIRIMVRGLMKWQWITLWPISTAAFLITWWPSALL